MDDSYFIFAIENVLIIVNETKVLLSVYLVERESVLFAELLKNEYRTREREVWIESLARM